MVAYSNSAHFPTIHLTEHLRSEIMLQIQDATAGQTTSVPVEIAGCVGVSRDMLDTVTENNQEPVSRIDIQS